MEIYNYSIHRKECHKRKNIKIKSCVWIFQIDWNYMKTQQTFMVGIKAHSIAIWWALDMDAYSGKKVPKIWRNLELDSVIGLYHINSRRDNSFGELMAPINSRSGSSSILERMTTTELPPLINHSLKLVNRY